MNKKSARLRLWRVTFSVLLLLLCRSNLPPSFGVLATSDIDGVKSSLTAAPEDAARAFLVLCTGDGKLYSLDAWTGKFRSSETTGPPLVTRSIPKDASGNDVTDTAASIVPGLDGRLYWQQSKEDGGSMQPLDLTISSLMDHPVRTCDDKDCGILTATSHTQLLALDQLGRLMWKSGSSATSTTNTATDEGHSQTDAGGRPDQTVLLQRKDFWVQQIGSSGKQVWNVTLGSYQALEFDDEDPGVEEDQWLLPGRVQDKRETLAATTGRSALPAIVFSDSGRTLSAVDPVSRAALWHIETPTILVSVFGLYKGRWRNLQVLNEENVKGQSEDLRKSPETRLLAASSHNEPDPSMDWWLQHNWWTPQTPASQQSMVTPQGLLPSASVERQPVCLSGDCPNFRQLPLALPAPPPVLLASQGLVVSWSTVAVFCFAVFVGAFGARLWYLRKKNSWLEKRADVSRPEFSGSSRSALKHSTSLPELRQETTRKARTHSDPDTIDLATTGSPLTQEVGPTVLQNGGIPLVRYSRYASEFEELAALGKGGFGTVFRCRNVLDGREYALKKVSIVGEMGEDAFHQRLQRVLREVKILAVLDHANIVRYYTAWLEIDKRGGRHTGDANNADGDGEATMSRRYSSSMLKEEVSQWTAESLTRRGMLYPASNPLGWRNAFGVSSGEPSLPSGRLFSDTAPMDDIGFIFERSEDDDTTCDVLQEPVSQSATDGILANGALAASRCSRPSFTSAGFSSDATPSDQVEVESKTGEHSAPTHHTLYIQMQLCSQKTVGDFLSNPEVRRGSSQSGIDVPAALSLFLQIVQAVRYVHAQSLIHRDLKPNNCFMDEAGTIKVGDFGLSREANDKGETTGGMTLDDWNDDQTAGVGTPSYASPEQMEGSDYDSSTDVFSLGILLFELLYPMYTGMERSICLTKLRQSEFPKSWGATVGKTFASLEDLIRKMMSRVPARRPSAEQVAEHIQPLLSEFTILSLDKHSPETMLLRVEAAQRENVLPETIQIIHEAAHPSIVKIVQYGLRSAKSGSKAIMEFALQSSNLQGTILVDKLVDHPNIIKAREVPSGSRSH